MDVGRNIVRKWKAFLEELEARHGLRVDSDGHVWLLHHLLLDMLNEQIVEWAAHWNAHTMRLWWETNKSPRQMFLQGARERNAPGMRENVEEQEERIENLDEFGINYDDLADDELINNLAARNGNPFEAHVPGRFNEVQFDAPEAPLMAEQLRTLDETLRDAFDMTTKNMEVWKLIWDRALTLDRKSVV